MPLGRFINADGYRRARRKAKLLADQYWSRWLREYVPTLQLRQKWLKPKRNRQVGDMVLLADKLTTRGKWPKRIVEENLLTKTDSFVWYLFALPISVFAQRHHEAMFIGGSG